MTRPKLCVVAMAPTLDELRGQRDASSGADLVELRLDAVTDLDVAGALAGRRCPVIVTCRASWEGGLFRGSEEERHRVLAEALELGAEYVDVEWRAGFTDLLRPDTLPRIVLSSHDFERVPEDLLGRARAMRATGAGIVKLASMATRLSDCVQVLETARDIGADGRSVFIAMGERGELSRVCAAKFAAAWTYAGAVAGIGQIDPKRLVEQYGFRSITGATRVFGIVGRPVSHSVSPAMHNAAFRATGIDAVYLSLPAVDADDFVTFARGVGLAGASVTIPFKVSLAERMDEVDPLARQVGAINTIRLDGARSQGANSDVAGFLQPLRDRRIALDGIRASILGAGGSARAALAALTSAGAVVSVHARTPAHGERLAEEGGARSGPWPVPSGSWDLLVNCTPVGMYPSAEASPVAKEALSGRTVYDLIYNPLETRLLRDARRAGCETIGGLDMLVAQAQDQFHWWTGTRPPAEVMRAAALERLAEFRAHENHHV